MNTTKNISKKTNEKIWIDLENSPHVLFFNPIIKELENQGYQVVVTARDYAQTVGLADLFHLRYKKIGRHFGKSKPLKVTGLLIRVLQLLPFLLKEKPAMALNHGSRSQALIAMVAGLPVVTTTDYEHGRKLPFVRSDVLIVPEVMPEEAIKQHSKQIFKYPGIKEDVYVQSFMPDAGILNALGIDKKEVVATIRPPATMAHYHNPEADALFEEVINHIGSHPDTRMVLVPRTKDQGIKIRKMWPTFFETGKIIIPEQVVDGLNLIWHSDMVLSGGGTMIREAAALGVPAYSFFRGTMGSIDQYLSETGRLTLLSCMKDIRTQIILDKRHQSVWPEPEKRPALKRIVDIIVASCNAR